MLVLEIIAGWILLSCVIAPLVGKCVSTNLAETEEEFPAEHVPDFSPAR